MKKWEKSEEGSEAKTKNKFMECIVGEDKQSQLNIRINFNCTELNTVTGSICMQKKEDIVSSHL